MVAQPSKNLLLQKTTERRHIELFLELAGLRATIELGDRPDCVELENGFLKPMKSDELSPPADRPAESPTSAPRPRSTRGPCTATASPTPYCPCSTPQAIRAPELPAGSLCRSSCFS